MRRALIIGLALFLLGFFLIRWAKEIPDAKKSTSSASKMDSSSRDRVSRFWSIFQEATQLRIQGNCRAAARGYREALELDSEHQESLYYLGSCLFDLGDYEEARRVYARLLELEPNSARGLSGLGILLSSPFPGNELDLDAARALFEKVLRINPEHSGPFLRLGSLSLQAGDLEEALADFQTAAGFRAPEGFFLSGMVQFRMGLFDAARQNFLKVLELQEHERAISRRGATSEGDIRRDSDSSRLSPLESAALKSRVLLAWIELAQARPGANRGGSSEVQAQPEERVQTVLMSPRESGSPTGWQRFGGFTALDRMAERREPTLPDRLEFTGKAVDVAFADFDRDGLEDIYLVRWKAPGILWKNLGEAGYEDVTEVSGLQGLENGLAAVFLDYDQDDQPDLFLAGQSQVARAMQHTLEPDLIQSEGTPQLFRNLNGHFSNATVEANLNHPFATLRVLSTDFNQDSWPDLLLVNGNLEPETLLPSTLLFNRQGRFQEYVWIPDRYIQTPIKGGAVGDFDADGLIEIYLAGGGLFRVH